MNPTPATHKCAQQMHKIAEDKGHTPVWKINDDGTGYEGRCTNPNCRIVITVDDDGSDELTVKLELPTCPLNTQP